MIIITLIVTTQYILMMNARDGTLVIEALSTLKNDETRIFTQEDGFQMAIAVKNLYSYEEFLNISVMT